MVLAAAVVLVPRLGGAETDLPTVLSIGIVSYSQASLLHEGLGHELGCVLGGGRPRGFSTAVAGCNEDDLTPGGWRWTAAGGAGANLLAGAGFATGLALGQPRDGSAYYFLWLSATVNLLQAGGYLLVGPWVPVGDFGKQGFVRDLDPRLPWQIGLSTLGVGITFGSLFLMNDLAEPLLGAEPEGRSSRRWTLTLWPYLVGSSFVTATGLLCRAGPEFALSAAVANFAGTLFLAYMPIFFTDDFWYPSADESPDRPLSIPRSTPWLVAAALTAVVVATVFGPGIGSFPNPHPLDPS